MVNRTLEDADGGGEVVDPPGSLERGDDDASGRDKIVGESVVEVALESCVSPLPEVFKWLEDTTYLELKNVLNTIKLLLEPIHYHTSAIGPFRLDLRPWRPRSGSSRGYFSSIQSRSRHVFIAPASLAISVESVQK